VVSCLILGYSFEPLSKRLGLEPSPRRRSRSNKLGQILSSIATVVGMTVLRVTIIISAIATLALLDGLRLLQLGVLQPFPIEPLLNTVRSCRSTATRIFHTKLTIGNLDDCLVGDNVLPSLGTDCPVIEHGWIDSTIIRNNEHTEGIVSSCCC